MRQRLHLVLAERVGDLGHGGDAGAGARPGLVVVERFEQDFFALPRGYLSAMLALDFDPASDESEYLYYLNNVQPSCVLNAANGLPGTLAASLAITANQIGFDSGELNDSKEVFGFDMAAKLVDNTTNVGPSGGFGPCIVSLINQVVNY